MRLSSSEALEQALSDAAWAQWTSLGVLGDRRQPESRCIDPEALIWLTFASGGAVDARLVDATRDWLALNRHLISIHRLRNVFGEERAALGDAMSALGGVVGANGARIKTTAKATEPDPMGPANLAIRLRLLMDAGSRSEVARFLLTWPGADADAHQVAVAAAFAKRNVNDILLSFVKGGVVHETWAGNRRVFSADKDRWCVFLGMRPQDLPGYVPWAALFRSATRILGWLEAHPSSQASAYLRSSSARDLVEAVGQDLVSCGIEVPDVRRYQAESFLEPFEAMVVEVAKTIAPQGV
jgi:hypothetical protein